MFPIPIVPPMVARMYEVRDGQVSRPSPAFAGGERKAPTCLRTFMVDEYLLLIELLWYALSIWG
jgi:hypothetical protein